jgi:hypothetical protein
MTRRGTQAYLTTSAKGCAEYETPQRRKISIPLTMFEPLQFNCRTSPNVAPLRYAVRFTTTDKRATCLQISMSRELAKQAGIKEGEGIRLDIDQKLKLGKIVVIPNERRSFRGKGRKAAAFLGSWPYNGQTTEFFPQTENRERGSRTVPLEVEEVSKANQYIVFRLP